MDIISHGLIGKIISTPENDKKSVFWVIFFSILPDIFILPLYFVLGYENSRFLSFPKNEDWISASLSHSFLYSFYDLSHSLIFAFIVILPFILFFKLPKLALISYFFHILIDLPAHTGEWAIKIFYPISNYSIKGFTDAWEWPIKYMLISWIILTMLIIVFDYLKKNAHSSNADRTNS